MMAAFTASAVLATFTGENRAGCHHFKVFNIWPLAKKELDEKSYWINVHVTNNKKVMYSWINAG